MLLILHRVLVIALFVAALGGLIIQAPAGTPWVVVGTMALITYLPLFVFAMPAWLADSRYLLWFSFVLLFYFGGFSMQTMNEAPLFYWVLVRLAAVVGLFTTSMLLIKQQQRARKAQQP